MEARAERHTAAEEKAVVRPAPAANPALMAFVRALARQAARETWRSAQKDGAHRTSDLGDERT
jgi:hypothetical protein